MKIMSIFGTRPETIKLAPLIHYFKKQNSLITSLVAVTGQHKEITSKEIKNLENNFQIFDITKSDANVSSIFGMIIWFFNFTFSNKKIKNSKISTTAYYMEIQLAL